MTSRLEQGSVVTVFGGSGFLGRHAVRALAREGWRVRAAVRRPDLAGHLQPMGAVGQIQPVQANLRYPDSVRRAVEGADAVVNLVGILAKTGAQTFDAVHVAGARAVASAARAAGAEIMVHVSALGADRRAKSNYARTKAAGEAAVLQEVSGAVILRPSLVFGPEDKFFNKFAGLARFLPALPLIGGGHTRFQPVHVGDVADALLRLVADSATAGKTYELGGPRVYSFRALLELMLHEIGRRRLLVSVPFGLASLQAFFLELPSNLIPALPAPPLTQDQVQMLRRDSVVSAGALTLGNLGIEPATLELVVPGYLARYRPGGRFVTPANG
jgi:NADH dehydrogenase